MQVTFRRSVRVSEVLKVRSDQTQSESVTQLYTTSNTKGEGDFLSFQAGWHKIIDQVTSE